MAKKKKKSFSRAQLISLFENKNYQKVVSKIKQFYIEDISKEELMEIYLNSLTYLSQEHFGIGDIQRALRDIEMALDLKELPILNLTKLKYFCYLERFEEAIEFSKIILKNIKEQVIKKEIVFYFLLANIYFNKTLDKNYLKILSKTKQNYILAIWALHNDDIEVALGYLKQCNPRSKLEKQNIEAIKSLINGKNIEVSPTKPLYRFLLLGDDNGLQNSKTTREIKPIVINKFKNNKQNEELKNLIELKSPIDTTILKNQDNINLVYNNIVLLCENNRYEQAYQLFLSYKDKLAILPESIYLLINIIENYPHQLLNEPKLIPYIKKYLHFNSKKLAPFALKYIFFTITFYLCSSRYKNIANQYIQLAKQYEQYVIFYMIFEISSLNKNNYSLDNFSKFFKTFDKVNEKIIKTTIDGINSYDEISDLLNDNDKIEVAKRAGIIAEALYNIELPHKKYKKHLLELLKAISNNILNFSISFYPKEYQNIQSAIHRYIKFFELDINDLPPELDAVLLRVATNSDDENRIENDTKGFMDIIKKLKDDIDFDSFLDEFDEFEDDEDLEEIFGEIFGNFKTALKLGENPFDTLEEFPKFYHWFYEPKYEDVVFLLMYEYSRYKTLTNNVIGKMFSLANFKLEDEIVRKRLPAILNQFAKNYDYEISLKILEYIIELFNKYETAWYLQWLYMYIEIGQKYMQKSNKKFNEMIIKFIELQKKKKFKTFEKKFNAIAKRNKIDEIDYEKYQQQSFDF